MERQNMVKVKAFVKNKNMIVEENIQSGFPSLYRNRISVSKASFQDQKLLRIDH